jgi:hypothetical protein
MVEALELICAEAETVVLARYFQVRLAAVVAVLVGILAMAATRALYVLLMAPLGLGAAVVVAAHLAEALLIFFLAAVALVCMAKALVVMGVAQALLREVVPVVVMVILPLQQAQMVLAAFTAAGLVIMPLELRFMAEALFGLFGQELLANFHQQM